MRDRCAAVGSAGVATGVVRDGCAAIGSARAATGVLRDGCAALGPVGVATGAVPGRTDVYRACAGESAVVVVALASGGGSAFRVPAPGLTCVLRPHRPSPALGHDHTTRKYDGTTLTFNGVTIDLTLKGQVKGGAIVPSCRRGEVWSVTLQSRGCC